VAAYSLAGSASTGNVGRLGRQTPLMCYFFVKSTSAIGRKMGRRLLQGGIPRRAGFRAGVLTRGLRNKVKGAGGIWRPRHKILEMSRSLVARVPGGS
jgi:hypothetical protein